MNVIRLQLFLFASSEKYKSCLSAPRQKHKQDQYFSEFARKTNCKQITFTNPTSVYLESRFFFRRGLAGFRHCFGRVPAWQAGFRRGCSVGYLESENILRKFDVNYSENKNASGGTCARGAKRPRVGRFTRCVSVFALIYVELSKYIFTF